MQSAEYNETAIVRLHKSFGEEMICMNSKYLQGRNKSIKRAQGWCDYFLRKQRISKDNV